MPRHNARPVRHSRSRRNATQDFLHRSADGGPPGGRPHPAAAEDPREQTFLLLEAGEGGIFVDEEVTDVPVGPDATPLPLQQSSLIRDEDRHMLREMYRTQNAVLLSAASGGAFLLLAINLVGVLFFKGYFKKKTPAGPVSNFPQSLSHSRRCRYSTLLRRFSLESQHDSILDKYRAEPRASYSGQAGAMSTACLHAGRCAQNAAMSPTVQVPDVLFLNEKPFVVCVEPEQKQRRETASSRLKRWIKGGRPGKVRLPDHSQSPLYPRRRRSRSFQGTAFGEMSSSSDADMTSYERPRSRTLSGYECSALSARVRKF